MPEIVDVQSHLEPLAETASGREEDDDPHDKVRVLDSAVYQTDVWLREGIVKPFCDQTCNPE